MTTTTTKFPFVFDTLLKDVTLTNNQNVFNVSNPEISKLNTQIANDIRMHANALGNPGLISLLPGLNYHIRSLLGREIYVSVDILGKEISITYNF